MVRKAHVVDGVVVRVSIVDALADGDIDGTGARRGDLYADGAFTTPPPTPPTERRVDGAAFLARIADDEYAAIMSAAAQTVQLAKWIDEFRLRGEINVLSEKAQAAKAMLVQAGILTAERAAVIFS